MVQWSDVKEDKFKKVREALFNGNNKRQALFCLMGFLLSRAVILDFLNPFSLAFLAAAVVLQDFNFLFVALSCLVGILSVGDSALILKYLFEMVLFIILFFTLSRTKLNRKLLAAVTAAFSNFVAGYFVFYIQNYFMYDLFMIIMESMLCAILILIYDHAFPIIKNYKKRTVLSAEEISALAVLISFCFVGTEITMWGFSIKNVSILLMVLLSAYLGSAGMGAAIGIILGIMQALSGAILPSTIGVYGLCGLMGGILKNVGKIGCPLGFILGNALMTYYINGSTEVLIKFNEILAASIIFMAIPQRFMNRITNGKRVIALNDMHVNGQKQEKSYEKRIKEQTMEKLHEVSDVFNALSETLKDSAVGREVFSQTDAAQIIDQVVDKNCKTCGVCANCWKRDFYRSYQYMFNLLSLIESSSDIEEISKELKQRCIKADDMIVSLRHFYDMYKSSLNWKKKIHDSRIVVSEQLQEVSSVVSGLALKINMDVDFNREQEELIWIGLDKAGIPIQDVSVTLTGSGSEIEIQTVNCGGKRLCLKDIIPIVNQCTGKKFVKKESLCNAKANNQCRIKLKEAAKYQIATGASRVSKSGTICGDNHSFMELKDGKYMLVLSDGMGSGPRAAAESSTAITLLEKFLYAGFDKDVAVKTINSLLLMRSSEESYTTIDMTVIDQYDGEVEFVKVGAVSTFIKHEDRVDIIRAGSLPVGILNNIDIEFVRKKLKDGDFVIMITDGILDANQNELNKEKWLASCIQNMDTRNPQKMAADILQMCLDQNDGIAGDDMTVLVAKIWEN